MVNGVSHIVSTMRLRMYNPGLVTSIVLFLPLTIWIFAHEAAAGMLTGTEIALTIVAGVLLHVPIAGLFVVPYLRKGAAAA